LGTFAAGAVEPPDGAHGESVALVDVRPSLTVIVQLVDVYRVLVIVNVPVLLAEPMTVPFTEIDAPLFAPLPWTESVVPWSEADETLMVEVVPPLPLPLPLPEPLLNDGASRRAGVAFGVTGSSHATVRTRDAAPHAITRRFTNLLIQPSGRSVDATVRAVY
jgi:hypothetical protein